MDDVKMERVMVVGRDGVERGVSLPLLIVAEADVIPLDPALTRWAQLTGTDAHGVKQYMECERPASRSTPALDAPPAE